MVRQTVQKAIGTHARISVGQRSPRPRQRDDRAVLRGRCLSSMCLL